MGLMLHNNTAAQLAKRDLIITTRLQSESSEKLSSGFKINKAADDAAGLAISEKLRREVRGLNQTLDNLSDGISYVSVADGALEQVDNMLQRMNELAVKSANGTLENNDRNYVQMEVDGLRDAIDNVFTVTTFNEKFIWRPNDKTISYSERVIKTSSNNKSIGVTNANSGVLPISSYTGSGNGYINIKASDDEGLSFYWKGENGKDYKTKSMSWEDFRSSDFKLNLSDLFDEGDPDTYNDLVDSNGDPVMDIPMSFDVSSHATNKDIAQNLDGGTIRAARSVTLNGNFEIPSSASSINGIMSVNVAAAMNYDSAYALNRNFDSKDDVFIEPLLQTTGGNLSSFPTSSDPDKGWEFKFKTETSVSATDPSFIGGPITLTAKSTSMNYKVAYTPSPWTYTATAVTDNYYGEWWDWSSRYNSTTRSYEFYPGSLTKNISPVTLGGMEKAFTGRTNTNNGYSRTGSADNDGYPGMLDHANGGHNPLSSGTFTIGFTLTADSDYTYGEHAVSSSPVNSKSVGSITLTINMNSNQSYDDAVYAITSLFNSATVLDLYSSGAGADNFTLYAPEIKDGEIPVSEQTKSDDEWHTLNVQSGTNSSYRENVIPVRYLCLDINKIGIDDIDVSSEDKARKAIGKVKNAMQIVNGQRTLFGAYYNRMSHARKANENTMINSQDSESKIRDADMADEMVKLAGSNIIHEAGMSIMTQSIRNREKALELLR